MKKLEIIKDVLEDVYCKNPSLRGISSNGKCVYETVKDGKTYNCAVGRCLTGLGIKFATEKGIGEVFEFYDDDKDDYILEDYLKEKYKGHNISFWEAIQQFHDDDYNFTIDGLSERGYQRFNSLKLKYIND